MIEKQKRKRFWKMIIIGGVLFFIVLPMVIVVGLAIARNRQQKNLERAEKRVPNLTSLDPKTAEAKAREAGFSMQVLGDDWNSPQSPCIVGTIAKQTPSAGESTELRQVAVTTCVEDPQKEFRNEQQRKR